MKKLVLSYELAWRTDEDKKFMKTVGWKKIRKTIMKDMPTEINATVHFLRSLWSVEFV